VDEFIRPKTNRKSSSKRTSTNLSSSSSRAGDEKDDGEKSGGDSGNESDSTSDSEEETPHERPKQKRHIRKKNSTSIRRYTFERSISQSFQFPQHRVSCTTGQQSVLFHKWISYSIESESESSPSSSLSSASQNSDSGVSGGSPSSPLGIARTNGSRIKKKLEPSSSLKMVSGPIGTTTTYVMMSMLGGDMYPSYNALTSQSFYYPMVSYSLSSIMPFSSHGAFFGNSKLITSQFPVLILADGRTEVRNGDATNEGRSAIIDNFFGFFHYYHQNQVSMLSWWRTTSRNPNFMLIPCPGQSSLFKAVESPPQQTQFPID